MIEGIRGVPLSGLPGFAVRNLQALCSRILPLPDYLAVGVIILIKE